MRRPACSLALLAAVCLGAASVARAQPIADDYEVEIWATATAPVGLSFGADGSLFVGRDEAGAARIGRIPPEGGAAAEYGPLPIPTPFGVFADRGGAFASESGAVVVGGSAAGAGGVVAILPSQAEPAPGAMLQELSAPGAGGLVAPLQVETRGSDLLILDPGANAVFVFPPGGPPAPLIASTPEQSPRSLAVAADGRIFVAHADGTIRQYAADGALVNGSLATGLAGNVAIAVSPGPNFIPGLLVVEGGTGLLLHLALDGDRRILGTGFPASPGELELGPDDALYVAAPADGLVYRVSPKLGPFVCYRAGTTPGEDPFPAQEITLADAFGAPDARASKTKALCNPAAVASDDFPLTINAELLTRLVGYSLRRPPPPPERRMLDVENIFGLQTVRTAGADRLLVPSAFSSGIPTLRSDTAVDPLQCYRARPGPSQTYTRRLVSVGDLFGDVALVRTLVVRKPKRVCLPAELNTVPAARPDALLVCYGAKLAAGEESEGVVDIHVGNALAAEHVIDMKQGLTPTRTIDGKGRTLPDLAETFVDDGRTRPGEWEEDSEGPRWSGGGPLSEDAESLRSNWSDSRVFEDVEVRRWRLFVEIDIAVNDTNEGPGVVMRSVGIPGIPDGSEVRAMAHGKPAGLRASSEFFTPPAGTKPADLLEAELTFEANGDGSSGAFAFQIKGAGVEYEAEVTAGGQGTGSAEIELCLPSTLR